MEHPEWWEWELRFDSHLLERMEERGVSEVELRSMFEDATAINPSRRSGRWRVSTHRAGRPWVVVVEPDYMDQITDVITVFPQD